MRKFEFFTTDELKKDMGLFKTAAAKYKSPNNCYTLMIKDIEFELERREPAQLVEAACCSNCGCVCDSDTCYTINPGHETEIADFLVCKHFVEVV